jgi:hypothetical protein
MNKMPWSEVLALKDEYEYLDPGQKVRVNHDNDCDGQSSSLIVEKKDDGSISAYCFRCGRSGYYGNRSALKIKQAREASQVTERDSNPHVAKRYPGGSTVLTDWPPKARAWIGKSGITAAEIEKYGIAYNDDIGRVVIPWCDDDGNVLSWQTRRVHDWDDKPKYLTYWRDRVPVVLDASGGKGRSIVLVEDFLSGIRVSRYSPVMVLQGVKLMPDNLSYIMQFGYNDFLVWLDDDNMQVKMAQLTLKRNLDKIGKCLIYHANGVDPKESTDEEIKSILARWKDGTL